MTLYEAVDLTEGEPVQYVGVHAVRWQREWGMPKLGFREVEDTRDDKIAALVRACERYCEATQLLATLKALDYDLSEEQWRDCATPVELEAYDAAKAAIKEAGP